MTKELLLDSEMKLSCGIMLRMVITLITEENGKKFLNIKTFETSQERALLEMEKEVD